MRKMSVRELESSFPSVFAFLCSHNLLSLDDGRYEIGENDYANIESYNTVCSKERLFESHKRFADIQCIIEGSETIIVEPVKNLQIAKKYDNEKDVVFYENENKGVGYILKKGEMILLLPEDGHMPCILVNESKRVKKAVFKIQISEQNRE